MSTLQKTVLFVYNLLLLIMAAAVLGLAAGRPEPLNYINMALATTEGRMISAAAAILVIALTVFVLISLFKKQPRQNSVNITSSLNGQVSITIDAIKVIIMKAVKKVEGVKEIRSAVKDGPDGLIITMHMMINPEHSVPEMSKNVQAAIRESLETIGGLTVAEVRVLVDDFAVAPKSTTL